MRAKDHDLALQRQKEWCNNIAWSDHALSVGHSRHRRLDDLSFQLEMFDRPRQLLESEGEQRFEFGDLIRRVETEQYMIEGLFYCSNDLTSGICTIPERFRGIV